MAAVLPPSPGCPGQDLHLNRAMLSHQRWPYVGRFARGWHRLPGCIPGQPQTRTRAHPRIGGLRRPVQCSMRQGPGGCRSVHLEGSGLAKSRRARGKRGSRGQDVVDEQNPLGRPPNRPERPFESRAPFDARALCLRRRRDGPTKQPLHGQVDATSERDRQGSCLIETALGSPTTSERYPRHDVDRRWHAGRSDGHAHRRGDITPTGELQSVNGTTGGTVVDERGSRGADRRRWTVGTRRHRRDRRRAASLTPRALQRSQGARALAAEWPRPRTTPRAGPWIHGIECAAKHAATLAAATDTMLGKRDLDRALTG